MPGIDLLSLDHAFDSIVITTAEIDPPGPRIVHVNAAFTRMTGYSPAEVIGLTPRILQGPRTDRRVLDRLRQALIEGRDAVLETFNYRKDGSEYALEWRVSPVRDDQGQVTHFFAIQREIGSRWLQHQAWADSGQVDLQAWNGVEDGLVTVDLDGRIKRINKSAEALLDWPAEAAVGRVVEEVVRFRQGQDKSIDSLARLCLSERRTLELADALWVEARNGHYRPCRLVVAPIRARDQNIEGLLVRLVTIGDERGRSAELIHDFVDRAVLIQRLEQVLKSAQQRGTVHAVCFLEVTPAEPDAALPLADWPQLEADLIATLRRRVRVSDTLGRLDFSSYALMLNHCPLDKAMEVAASMLDLAREYFHQRHPRGLLVAVGLTPFTAEAREVEEILERGRQACADARLFGGRQVQVFRSDTSELARRKHEVVQAVELLRAMDEDRLELFGQVILPLRPHDRPVFELLLRMRLADGQLVPPGAFVTAAERYDLTETLDRWVIESGLRTFAELSRGRDLGVALNLSAKSLSDPNFVSFVRAQLQIAGLPPERICFEITETAAIADLGRARDFLAELKKIGCKCALDDFGGGHSSFLYLKHLRVDCLKIDGQLIREMSNDLFSRAAVEAILQLARVVGAQVVAEWVETEETWHRLEEMGVDYVQGFAVGRPKPLAQALGELVAC